MYDYIIIGAGMIGSAAARYLSITSDNVALIGPDEPTDWDTHRGVFGSAYDSGRITRRLDGKLTWGRMASRSIDAYQEIEKKSGIRFYYETGGVMVSQSAEYINNSTDVGMALGAEFHAGMSENLPEELGLRFPAGYDVLLEYGGAGYINPREMVAAQLAVAKQQGVEHITETVMSVVDSAESTTVTTDGNRTLTGRKVVIAAGAYSKYLLPQSPKLEFRPRTIVKAQIDWDETARLAMMPTIIYDDVPHPALEGIYAVPPAVYPDGKTYIKIGGQLGAPEQPQTHAELADWFNKGGSQAEAEALEQTLRDIVPDLRVDAILSKPCVTTYTANGYPYVDDVSANIVIAAGGCGAAAKSSNEIGRLASLVATELWDDAYNREDFAVVFE